MRSSKIQKLKRLNEFNRLGLFLICAAIFLAATENSSAQNPAFRASAGEVEVEKFDWFEGYDWTLTNEIWKNSGRDISSKNRPFSEISAENLKFLEKRKAGFIYQLTVKNNSDKKILGINWNYTFINPLTGEILANHLFNSSERIKPRQAKDIFVFSSQPPTNVISVELLTVNPKKPYSEKAKIISVEFENK